MIRYRRSPYYKRWVFCVSSFIDDHNTRNQKPSPSVGSMVARLKLERIDGRAPQEMELAA